MGWLVSLLLIEHRKGERDDVHLEDKSCLRYSHVELGLRLLGLARGEPSLVRNYHGTERMLMILLLLLMQGQEAILVGLRMERRSELSCYR